MIPTTHTGSLPRPPQILQTVREHFTSGKPMDEAMLARTVGVTLPLYSCEHMYIVTKRIAGVFPDLPCLRDPDGYIVVVSEWLGLGAARNISSAPPRDSNANW